jgi:hypothetical protein
VVQQQGAGQAREQRPDLDQEEGQAREKEARQKGFLLVKRLQYCHRRMFVLIGKLPLLLVVVLVMTLLVLALLQVRALSRDEDQTQSWCCRS